VVHPEEISLVQKTGLMLTENQNQVFNDFRRSDKNLNYIERDLEMAKFKADDRGKKTPMPLKDTKSTLQFRGGVF
jgi:predicted DNA-binding protein YlxM (UPF0122 family)